MRDEILALQEMREAGVDAQGQAEPGFGHLGSFISIFSDCTTVFTNR